MSNLPISKKRDSDVNPPWKKDVSRIWWSPQKLCWSCQLLRFVFESHVAISHQGVKWCPSKTIEIILASFKRKHLSTRKFNQVDSKLQVIQFQPYPWALQAAPPSPARGSAVGGSLVRWLHLSRWSSHQLYDVISIVEQPQRLLRSAHQTHCLRNKNWGRNGGGSFLDLHRLVVWNLFF